MSAIAWTEQTWNPIVGCSKVSTGCLNCYAERMAGRLFRMGVAKERQRREAGIPPVADAVDAYTFVIDNDWGGYVGGWNGKTVLVESALDKPLKRKKPTMYFVCSMGDLFHESVPDEWIDRVFSVMAGCPQHTFQILTKRSERLQEYFKAAEARCIEALGDGCGGLRVLPNVWLGVTAENQEQADKRIPHLLCTPAAVRFVSVEPMLGMVDLTKLRPHRDERVDALKGYRETRSMGSFHSSSEGRGLDWVICGCESGPGRRPMGDAWADDLRRQCKSAGVSFFMKQLSYDGRVFKELKDFPNCLRVREWPELPKGQAGKPAPHGGAS